MTRKEAIKILEEGRNPHHNIDTDIWCEAFEMAIEALKLLTSYEHTINEFNKIVRGDN